MTNDTFIDDTQDTQDDQHAQDLVHIELVLNIVYDANGVDPVSLRNIVENAIEREMANGGMTGGSDAVVNTRESEVVLMSPAAAGLDQEALAAWFQVQIESGSFPLRSLAHLMAEYALATPANMRIEFAERMQLEDSADTEQGNSNQPVFIG